MKNMNYDGYCDQPGALVDCDCDACLGYVWKCPDCGAGHQQDLPECEECDWVSPKHVAQCLRDYLISGQFEAAANCWLHTKYANTALETKLTEITKTGGDVLMCHLREIAKLAFVAALEESK
jgi:hypothetical protein